MDYYISSSKAEPREAQSHYSEQLALLNHFAMYCRRPPPPQHKLSRKDMGVGDHENLYACVQSLFKIHPDFDEIVAEILRRDPDGIVLFFEDKHAHWARQLRRRFSRTLPDVCQRIRFQKRLSPQYFQAFLQVPDVILDTLHFSAG